VRRARADPEAVSHPPSRAQVDKNLYKSNMDGWKKIHAEGGVRGL
jgi:hypothetical protein